MLINNLYGEELRSSFRRFNREQELIKNAILDELKKILRKSQYDSIDIYNGMFYAYKDGEELEDENFDYVINYLIHDFNNIDDEEMCFEFFRSKDF
jgi:hypothetical protein